MHCEREPFPLSRSLSRPPARLFGGRRVSADEWNGMRHGRHGSAGRSAVVQQHLTCEPNQRLGRSPTQTNKKRFFCFFFFLRLNTTGGAFNLLVVFADESLRRRKRPQQSQNALTRAEPSRVGVSLPKMNPPSTGSAQFSLFLLRLLFVSFALRRTWRCIYGIY